jgi:hypothetical protein
VVAAGVIAIGLGSIGIMLGINDRVTSSLTLRRYLIEQFRQGGWFGRAQFARIPIGLVLLAGGWAAVANARSLTALEQASISVAVVCSAVSVLMLVHTPRFLMPRWFRIEQSHDFPLLRRELHSEPKPAVLRLASAMMFALIGMLVVVQSIPLGIALIAVGIGVGYGDRFLQWPRKNRRAGE